MGQFYFDVSRESEPNALPDGETFYIDNDDHLDMGEDGEPLASGWYWWPCLPGCLPDGEPMGPFETEEEALANAREGYES